MGKRAGQDEIIVGVVESIDDPTYSGRIKVRVKGFHDNLKTEELPWCTYAGSSNFSGTGGGSISIPRVGATVRVRFKDEKSTSMEWTGTGTLDKELINEIKSDYAGSHVLLYDTASDISIKFQPGSGLVLYYKGSYIQITPDNNITIHYGEGATGTQIQLSNGRVDIQAQTQINITSGKAINLEADTITLNGNTAVQIKGDKAGECAINGVQLISALLQLAQGIDAKVPQTAGQEVSYVNAVKEGLLNQSVQYI